MFLKYITSSGKITVFAPAGLKKNQIKTLKETSRKFCGYIWYSKLHNFRKKRKIMGILEPINFRILESILRKQR